MRGAGAFILTAIFLSCVLGACVRPDTYSEAGHAADHHRAGALFPEQSRSVRAIQGAIAGPAGRSDNRETTLMSAQSFRRIVAKLHRAIGRLKQSAAAHRRYGHRPNGRDPKLVSAHAQQLAAVMSAALGRPSLAAGRICSAIFCVGGAARRPRHHPMVANIIPWTQLRPHLDQ